MYTEVKRAKEPYSQSNSMEQNERIFLELNVEIGFRTKKLKNYLSMRETFMKIRR